MTRYGLKTLARPYWILAYAGIQRGWGQRGKKRAKRA